MNQLLSAYGSDSNSEDSDTTSTAADAATNHYCRKQTTDSMNIQSALQESDKRRKQDSFALPSAHDILGVLGGVDSDGSGSVAGDRKRTQHVDNPEEHQNRTRSFAHVDGNWPSLVYLAVSTTNTSGLDRACSQVKQAIIKKLNTVGSQASSSKSTSYNNNNNNNNDNDNDSNNKSNKNYRNKNSNNNNSKKNNSNSNSTKRKRVGRKRDSVEKKPDASAMISIHDIEDPHMSLSRPFTLRFQQIKRFVADVRVAVARWQAWTEDNGDHLRSGMPLTLSGACMLFNDYSTRLFGALGLSKGANQVCSLIETIDSVMRAYDKPVYYKNPTPHMSVAWTLWNQSKEDDVSSACAKEPSATATTSSSATTQSASTDNNNTIDDVSVDEEESDTEEQDKQSKIKSRMTATHKVHAVAWKVVVRCGNREHEVSLFQG